MHMDVPASEFPVLDLEVERAYRTPGPEVLQASRPRSGVSLVAVHRHPLDSALGEVRPGHLFRDGDGSESESGQVVPPLVFKPPYQLVRQTDARRLDTVPCERVDAAFQLLGRQAVLDVDDGIPLSLRIVGGPVRAVPVRLLEDGAPEVTRGNQPA